MMLPRVEGRDVAGTLRNKLTSGYLLVLEVAHRALRLLPDVHVVAIADGGLLLLDQLQLSLEPLPLFDQLQFILVSTQRLLRSPRKLIFHDVAMRRRSRRDLQRLLNLSLGLLLQEVLAAHFYVLLLDPLTLLVLELPQSPKVEYLMRDKVGFVVEVVIELLRIIQMHVSLVHLLTMLGAIL